MTDPSAGLESRLAQLRMRYLEALPGRLAQLREAVEGLASASAGPAERFEAYRQAHNIAGSAGTYGFPALSAPARAVESHLKRWVDTGAPVEAPERSVLILLLNGMIEVAAKAGGPGERVGVDIPGAWSDASVGIPRGRSREPGGPPLAS